MLAGFLAAFDEEFADLALVVDGGVKSLAVPAGARFGGDFLEAKAIVSLSAMSSLLRLVLDFSLVLPDLLVLPRREEEGEPEEDTQFWDWLRLNDFGGLPTPPN